MASSSPPPLTATERAIIESIRRGAPDAEIAARLGITIGEVKTRIDALRARFGKSERSGLATVDLERELPPSLDATVPPQRPASATGTYSLPPADDTSPTLPFDPRPKEPAHSRRAVLGMMGVGAATLAGVGAYYLASRDGSTTPARPDPFATNTPAPTLSPPATSTPHPGVALIEPVEGAFEVLHFGRNEAIDVDHGICFMDTLTGAVTCYRLADSMETKDPTYDASPTNQFVSARSFERQFVLDRNAHAAHGWPTNDLELVALGDRRIVVREMVNRSGSLPGSSLLGDRLLVLDAQMQIEQPISLKVTRVGAGGAQIYPRTAAQAVEGLLAQDSGLADHLLEGILSPDESEFAALTSHQGIRTVSLIDLDRRTVIVLMAVSRSEETVETLRQLAWIDERRFTFTKMEWPAQQQSMSVYSPQQGSQQQFLFEPRTGLRPLGPPTEGGLGQFVSPNGAFMAYERYLRVEYGEDVMHWWPALVVADAEGNRQFGVKSASLTYGDMFDGTRWLADSSAVVALVQGEGAQDYRYALVDAQSGELTYLPPFQAPGDQWWSRASTFAPMPSPDRPNLFSVGRTALFDLETGDFVAPPIPEAGPTHLPPWGTDSAEMRFAFPHLGHGGGHGPTLLTPHVEFPPLDDGLRFVVTRSETCLNLRSGPSLEADILTCLSDGTLLELAPPEDGSPEPTPGADGFPAGEPFPGLAVHANWEDDIRYARVRTDAGQEGWVAIQYLDWAP